MSEIPAGTSVATDIDGIPLDILLRRTVRIIDAAGDAVELGSLSSKPAVVLLGDPGMGKSTSLNAVAASVGCWSQKVRSFLITKSETRDGQPRFLDALDEFMALGKDLTVLDQTAARLDELGWPPFWLSCRHADWARTDGKNVLGEILRDRLTVAQLLPLTREDIMRAAIHSGVDAAAFLKAMEGADLLPILENPESLRLTLKIFNDYGAPSSRSDLYEKATERLASESNGTHAQAGPALPGPVVREAAGGLAATLLLSGEDEILAPGVSGGRGVSGHDFMALVSEERVRAVLSSRLSTSTEPGLWTLGHRTVSEYLAAKFLADSVAGHGLPLTQVLGTVCDDDGYPKSSLRGLFAWLAAAMPIAAREFVDRDPYGVVVYGDASGLAPEALKAVWRGLRRLVDKDPFFRSGRWHDPGFKAFCNPAFAADFREVLAERPVRPHLLGCVFDAVEQGGGLQSIAEDLEAFVLDTAVPAETRRAATFAFLECAGDGEAAGLFRRMLRDGGADLHRQFSGLLLRSLYPRVLGTDDLCDFITRYSELPSDLARNPHLHMDVVLPGLIPAGAEALILDAMNGIPALLAVDRRPSSPRAELRRLARTLFARAITGMPPVDSTTAMTWLRLIETDGEYARGQEEIRAALVQRPDLYLPFLFRTCETSSIKRQNWPHSAIWRLARRLPYLEPPADAVERLLAVVEDGLSTSEADIPYVSAFNLMVRQNRPELLERFWIAGDGADRLRELRGYLLYVGLDHARDIREERESIAQREANAARAVKSKRTKLNARVDGIKDGTDRVALAHLAREWFGLHWHSDGSRDLAREERMSKMFSPETLSAADEGFKTLAMSALPLRPEDLETWDTRGEPPWYAYATLAGADLLFQDDPATLLGLGPDRLTGLLCLGMTIFTQEPDSASAVESRPWLGAIAELYPEESGVALLRLLTPRSEGNLQGEAGIAELLSNEGMAPTRNRLLPSLLRAAHPGWQYFPAIIRAAAANLERGTLVSIVRERLAGTDDGSADERWRWLLLSWRLSPEPHEDELRTQVGNSDDKLSQLMRELGTDHDGFHPAYELPLTLGHRIAAVELAGPRFPPVSVPGNSWSPPTDYDRAQFVHRHIQEIGETPGAGSGAALAAFLGNPSLAAFWNSIKHALVNWGRNGRPNDTAKPSPRQVARSLAGGAPATSGGLHAFVLDHLRDTARTLKTDRGNLWAMFWNLDGNGKPLDARPENSCTATLAAILKTRLEQAGLSTEVEAQHVGGTRCDIAVRGIGAAVPIEAKCDWNDDLWIGWRTQLRDRYSCEPAARGFGVYLIYWFGTKRGKGRKVPSGHAPVSAGECEEILRSLMAAEAPRLVPVVFDLTPLPSRSDERKERKTKETPPKPKGGSGKRKTKPVSNATALAERAGAPSPSGRKSPHLPPTPPSPKEKAPGKALHRKPEVS